MNPGGMGMGLGGLMAGSFLSSIAGVVIGTAVADAILNDGDGGPRAIRDPTSLMMARRPRETRKAIRQRAATTAATLDTTPVETIWEGTLAVTSGAISASGRSDSNCPVP